MVSEKKTLMQFFYQYKPSFHNQQKFAKLKISEKNMKYMITLNYSLTDISCNLLNFCA